MTIAKYRHDKLPNTTSKEAISSDAAVLLPLIDQSPHLNIITPSSPIFAELNRIFQLDTNSVPLALIRPNSVSDVAAIVRFATSTSPPIPVCVRGGGHDNWDRSNVSGSIVIDMKEMDDFKLASDGRLAVIGGGTTALNLVKNLTPHGLVAAVGNCNTVGYVGWATAGGYGCLNGGFGLGVDQIVAASLVTPSGEIVDQADEEVLWALRGGGCNFGVVTSLTIKVYPVRKILAGLLVYPVQEAKNILLKYQEILDEDFPNAYGGEFAFLTIPGVGKVLSFFYQWISNDLKAGNDFLNKLRALGTAIMDTVSETTQADWMEAAASLAPTHLFVNMRSTYSPLLLTDIFVDVLVEFAAAIPSAPQSRTMLFLHPLHGLGASPNSKSCFRTREAHYLVEIIGASSTKEATPADYTWADNLERTMKEKGLVIEGAYTNLSEPGWGEITLEKFFGKYMGQLKDLKQRLDPGNVFSAIPSLA